MYGCIKHIGICDVHLLKLETFARVVALNVHQFRLDNCNIKFSEFTLDPHGFWPRVGSRAAKLRILYHQFIIKSCRKTGGGHSATCNTLGIIL